MSASHFGGDGPRLLMVHGFGADRLGWIGTAPALFPLVECWVVDLPGHGESSDIEPATELVQLAQQIDLPGLIQDNQPVHLLGHSLGGSLSLLLAAAYPDYVASLTLIAPSGLGRGVTRSFIAEYPTLDDAVQMRRWLETLVENPDLIADALVKRALEQLDQDNSRTALNVIGQAVGHGEAEIGRALDAVISSDVPRLVIWGEQDRVNPPSAADQQTFGGQWLMLPNCGHLPHVEQRKPVTAAIESFLRSSFD
ncbi:MAG: alpha/beta fold hydrolase [Gammaproteobacteria bacterium]|nr:alpha/beta fold hydrolase [Gammaproteobacteria bacterium]